MYDIKTQKWHKLPGLKVACKNSTMLKVLPIEDKALYWFWTGFSSEFGKNIYYLKLKEGEVWKQVQVEVDERASQWWKPGVFHIQPNSNVENDSFLIFGGIQSQGLSTETYLYDCKTQLILRRIDLSLQVRDQFNWEGYYVKDNRLAFAIGASTMHIFDFDKMWWDVKALEDE